MTNRMVRMAIFGWLSLGGLMAAGAVYTPGTVPVSAVQPSCPETAKEDRRTPPKQAKRTSKAKDPLKQLLRGIIL